jgi:hypothetical protein
MTVPFSVKKVAVEAVLRATFIAKKIQRSLLPDAILIKKDQSPVTGKSKWMH